MSLPAGRGPEPRALVFIPVNPFPPRSGLHHRCLEIISGLRTLGYRVAVASSPWSDPGRWDSDAAARPLSWADELHLYRPGRWDNRLTRFLEPYGRRRGLLLPLDSAPYVPPRMRWWFSRLVQQLKPDLVYMVHAYWDALLDHRRFAHLPRVMETIDLVSLNARMWAHLQGRLPAAPSDPAACDPALLDEGFFDRAGLQALPDEFRVYDRYAATVAISRSEADAIERSTRRTRVVHLPMTLDPAYPGNRYDGPALFPTGPNPFNVQAYLYFVRRVLPLVLRREPGFVLRVTGYCDASRVAPCPGVELAGWVDDLRPVQAAARFAVSPVFGGTGQQVKIVEAMANGLPVVALRSPAERSPLEHGVSGLVADDAAEFADHVVRLWRDPALCRTMGEAARETIRREYSRDAFAAGLARVVEAARGQGRSPRQAAA